MLALRRFIAVLAVVALGPIVHALPASAANPSTSDFALTYDDTTYSDFSSATPTYSSVISTLENYLPLVSLTGVPLTTTPASSCSDALPSAATAICWSAGDASANEWIPQGITTSNDAFGYNLSASYSRIIVSWYDGCNPGTETEDWHRQAGMCTTEPTAGDIEYEDKGVRLTIYSRATGKYRTALLVEPFINSAGHASYKAVKVHSGGIALYGDLLYVADTRHGIRVFDTTQFFSLESTYLLTANTTDKNQVGRKNNVFYGFSYHFILPQVGAWKMSGTATSAKTCDGSGPMKFSYLGLDRSTVSLIAGEYCDPSTAHPGRIARWPISSIGLAGGTAWDAHYLPVNQVQGAVTRGNTFYLNKSAGSGSAGTLYKYTLDSSDDLTFSDSATAAVGCEDLSYDTVSGRIYSVAEYFGSRAMYYLNVF